MSPRVPRTSAGCGEDGLELEGFPEHSGKVEVQGSLALKGAIEQMSDEELDALDILMQQQAAREAAGS